MLPSFIFSNSKKHNTYFGSPFIKDQLLMLSIFINCVSYLIPKSLGVKSKVKPMNTANFTLRTAP